MTPRNLHSQRPSDDPRRDEDRAGGDRGPQGGGPSAPGGPGSRRTMKAILRSFAITLAITLLIASFLPPEIRAATITSFLFFAAIANAILALMSRTPLFPPYFSRWDQAAILYLISMATATFVDYEAALRFLEEAQQMRGGL